jgi:NDP-4-keto-2,6-dideoxyhexose 3-C-methyltransferase
MVYTERTTCRLCDGEFKDIISLGDVYLSTFVEDGNNLPPKAPIELAQCKKCDLVQLRHTVNPEYMYSDYWYQSGLNQSMIEALRDVVNRVQSKIELKEGDIVLDIGANDGTLLTNYPDYVIKVACEPSNLYTLISDKADIVINEFFSAKAYIGHTWDHWYTAFTHKPAKVITAIAMFYDLEDPHTFVEDLAYVLAPDGLLVIQMMDFMSMVKLNDFPNLCHEHLEYYSLQVLYDLLNQHGLEIIDVEYNGVNGGSLRVYAKHADNLPHAYTAINGKAYRNEIVPALDYEIEFFSAIDLPTYFRDHIELVRDRVVSYVKHCNTDGLDIAVLGASTKGNTILQYFNLDDTNIVHAAEVNPDKFGKRTVGSNIPIIPQSESLASNPSHYLVLPWGFIDFFVKKFDGYLKNGGRFIVPLPTPRIILSENGKIVEYTI